MTRFGCVRSSACGENLRALELRPDPGILRALELRPDPGIHPGIPDPGILQRARETPDGVRIADERIFTNEQFTDAARGGAEVLPNGTVRATGCFAAGTLVHTADGLVPIEKIRVGMHVLSQPEDGGERAMRRVVNKVTSLDQPLMAVQVHIEGDKDSELATIFATPNHPFWVETPLVDTEDGRQHWLAAECLEPCMTLQLADGRSAEVRSAAIIRRTQHEDIFFAGDERVDLAQVLCLRDGCLEVASSERVAQVGRLDLGDRYLTPVYNFEVEEFHTYYVGEVGVWVHNTNCAEWTARKADRDAPRTECFPPDTYVIAEESQWFEIDRMGVGTKVLSRCEKTGKQEFKRITRVYEHMVPDYEESSRFPGVRILYVAPDSRQYGISVTLKHPFWVNGQGWVNAEELKPGQKLEICDPIGETDVNRRDGSKMLDYALSGKRWQVEVLSVERDRRFMIVYNIEVEDFHTYFVGRHGIWVHNKDQGRPVFEQVLKESNPDARPFSGRNGENRRSENSGDESNRAGARGENEAADILARHDNLEVVQLPASNTLGKLEGNPDLLINDRTADVFTPQPPDGGLASLSDTSLKSRKVRQIYSKIQEKSVNQSSDIVVNLNQLEGRITGADLLENIRNFPIPTWKMGSEHGKWGLVSNINPFVRYLGRKP
jgi:hypothetical protein